MKKVIATILTISILSSMCLAFQTVVSADISENLAVWLTMDMDTSDGDFLQDASGRNIKAKIQNNPLASTGAIDGAIQFVGSGSCVMLPPVVNADFSISFWVKTNIPGPDCHGWWLGLGLVDAEAPGVTDDFGISLSADKIIFGVGNPEVCIKSETGVVDDKWHHVVCTREKDSGKVAIYIDGKLDAQGVVANRNYLSAPKQFKIGGVNYAKDFVGAIDEVRVYKAVISEADIKTLYSKENQVPPEIEDDVNPLYRTSAFVKDSNTMVKLGFAEEMTTGKKPIAAKEIDGTLYVSSRFVAAAFDTYSKWNSEDRSISIANKGRIATMKEGSDIITMQDGSTIQAKGALKITDNTTVWLPFLDYAQALGYKVVQSGDFYIASTKTITQELINDIKKEY